MTSYDLIVIGGGSGGSACAKRAAGYGAKVLIVERGATRDAAGTRVGAGVGGTCVNVGCVPKKLMWMAAHQREQIVGSVATAAGNGFTVPASAGEFDWVGMKKRRDAYVTRLNGVYENGWKKLGIDVVMGLASFESGNSVRVARTDGTETVFEGKHILIACGGQPTTLDIPGKEHSITSDGFFDLETMPKKVAVVGAGYIAVEMAGILHGLGCEAHLVFRGETVFRRGFDPFIVETLMLELEAHGPELHKSSSPVEITVKDGKKSLVLAEGTDKTKTSIDGLDCVLMAIGRKPVTNLLALEKAGVKTNKGGFIEVDEYENTSTANVYAIGDATTTGYELTPVAIAAGRRLGDRLFGGEPKARINYETIATVVFSHPPIGAIGLTEPAAVEKYGADKIRSVTARFPSMMYAFNAGENKVLSGMKLVMLLPTERIVGLHCIGPQSDEMMQGFAVAIRMGATRRDFEASIAIHPTIGEEFVTFAGWGQSDGKPQLPPYLDASM